MYLVSNRNNFGLYQVNLATGAATTLLSPNQGFTLSWPYLLMVNTNYTGSGKPNLTDHPPTTLLNLATGKQTDLTQTLGFSYYFFSRFAMDGATIFTTQPTAAQDGTQFIELDHADQPNPQPRVLFTLHNARQPMANDVSLSVDARLLVIHAPLVTGHAGVWDRQLQKLIILPTPPANLYSPAELLSNGTLLYWQQSGSAAQVVLRDEAQLPN